MLTTTKRNISAVRQHALICEMLDAYPKEKHPWRHRILYAKKTELDPLMRKAELRTISLLMGKCRIPVRAN